MAGPRQLRLGRSGRPTEPRLPARGRILARGRGQLGWEHELELAVLYLQDQHVVEGVLALSVEFETSVEGVDVHAGEGLTHPGRFQALCVLDGVLQSEPR